MADQNWFEKRKNFVTGVDVRILLVLFLWLLYGEISIYFTALDVLAREQQEQWTSLKRGFHPPRRWKKPWHSFRRDEVDPEISSMHTPCTLRSSPPRCDILLRIRAMVQHVALFEVLLRFEIFRKHPRGRVNYDDGSKRETLFRGPIKILFFFYFFFF